MRSRIYKAVVVVAGIALGLVLPTAGLSAATVEFPLACAGTYPTHHFVDFLDLRATFSEISSLAIRWSGQATGALISRGYDHVVQVVDAGVFCKIELPRRSVFIEMWAGRSTYPDPEQFTYESVYAEANPVIVADLLGGTRKIIVTPNFLVSFPENPVVYLTQPMVLLDGATLIVTGTLVPEPVGVSLLVAGVSGLLMMRRRKNET